MRISGPAVGNFLLFLLLAAILASLQCSLWLQFFGYFPAPQLWLTTLAYWSIYRRPSEALFMVYALTIVANSLSSIPMSLLLPIDIGVFVVLFGIKRRIFWSGATYFTLLSFIATIVFPIFHIAISWLFEDNPITDPELLDWILSALITALISLPLFQLYQKLDKLTHKELPSEAGSTSYE